MIPLVEEVLDRKNLKMAVPIISSESNDPSVGPRAYFLQVSPEEEAALVGLGTIAKDGFAFNIIRFGFTMPTYVLSLAHLYGTLEDITDLIMKILSDDPFQAIILDLARSNPNIEQGEPDIDLIYDVLNSVKVTQTDWLTQGGIMEKATHLYIRSPAGDLESFNFWKAKLRSLDFSDPFIGTGALIGPWKCLGCFGVDHPTGLCPFPKVPGWQGPPIPPRNTAPPPLPNATFPYDHQQAPLPTHFDSSQYPRLSQPSRGTFRKAKRGRL
ncbi:hypothetical protein NLI96_g8029 [Meripilus lineatus]|uniref:Uncharacterized protein n=1 Tax=Meripilus lineatus TaxID=2056292 RepID=A0AAD5V0B1_9APHY|nr:hypothetical protein NLI96_g8029 [Physisporinus lineatus]